MNLIILSIFFTLFLCSHGLIPYETAYNVPFVDAKLSENGHVREKRSVFPWVVGETILDIQCKRGYLTVCAPDGPDACPIGYSSQTNVGVCGFATLNHYLNTSNLAGTCCYKLADTSAVTTTSSSNGGSNTTAQTILTPQIIAYPVYAQYPYAISSGSSSGSTGMTGSTGTSGTSGTSYGTSYGSSATPGGSTSYG